MRSNSNCGKRSMVPQLQQNGDHLGGALELKHSCRHLSQQKVRVHLALALALAIVLVTGLVPFGPATVKTQPSQPRTTKRNEVHVVRPLKMRKGIHQIDPTQTRPYVRAVLVHQNPQEHMEGA